MEAVMSGLQDWRAGLQEGLAGGLQGLQGLRWPATVADLQTWGRSLREWRPPALQVSHLKEAAQEAGAQAGLLALQAQEQALYLAGVSRVWAGELVVAGRKGHLPLEYLVAGGVFLALAVLGFLYRRARQAAPIDNKGGKIAAKRLEPEGREEPRPETRSWKKPAGVRSPGAVEQPREKPAWRKPVARQEAVARPPANTPRPPAVTPGKFQLSQPLEHVAAKAEQPAKTTGWFGSKASEEPKKMEEPEKKSGWFGSKATEEPKKVEEAVKKSGWFGAKTAEEPKTDKTPKKVEVSKNIEVSKIEEAPKKNGWFGSKSSDDSKKKQDVGKAWKARAATDHDEEERKFEAELAEVERKAVAECKSAMKPVRLNIEKNPRSVVESKRKKEKEVLLVKQMCGQLKENIGLDEKANLAREEKKEELAKVRSARSYFKTVDKHRSESMSAVPRIRFRTEEEVSDSYSRGNRQRLSQFEPGKISSKFSEIFDQTSDGDSATIKPPKKKLITLDEVLLSSPGTPLSENEARPVSEQEARVGELRAVATARRNWQPPEDERPNSRNASSPIMQEISSLNTTPVKARWNQGQTNDQTQSPVPPEISRELEELRESRPTPVTKRWNVKQPQARSQSAHVLQRTRLPDDCWVHERPGSRLEEERQKATRELEEVKAARLETLGSLEDDIERPTSSSRMDQDRLRTARELEEVKRARLESLEVCQGDRQQLQAQTCHEQRVQQSYQTQPEVKAREEVFRDTIEAQRTKREAFEKAGDRELGDLTMESRELGDLTMEDVALAIAMESLEDIDGILNRLNNPDPEEEDIDELKSEMEILVSQAEQIEAKLEHIESEVQVVINDCGGSEDDLSLDDEVRRITGDLANRSSKGPTQFEPGRISANFKQRFETPSPGLPGIRAAARPKKKLISLEQVIKRTPSTVDVLKQQREVEMEEVKTARRSWAPPSEAELSFNKIVKSATAPAPLKVQPPSSPKKKASGQESPTLAALRQQGRAGEDWLREEPGRQTPGQSGREEELVALRQARRSQVEEEVGPLYSTRQEVEEKARLQRELQELRGSKGGTVRSIRKELEMINVGAARKENERVARKVDGLDRVERVERVLPDPSYNWGERGVRKEQEVVAQEGWQQEQWQGNSQEQWQGQRQVQGQEQGQDQEQEQGQGWWSDRSGEQEEPVYSKVNKSNKAAKKVEAKEAQKELVDSVPEAQGVEEEGPVEAKKSDSKIKEKLAQLRKQTEEEVMRMKEKTSTMVNSIKMQRETERGRSRTVKSQDSEEHVTLRSKSMATIMNAGQKVKELAGGGQKARKGKKNNKL